MSAWGKLFDEDIAEFSCFVCKDAGEVRVCDSKNCLKAYHPRCVGKDDDYLSSDDQFICDWHKCSNCKKNSDYQCFCCPNSSACGDCIGKIEFVQVKLTKGFCNNCLKMAVMIETNVDAYMARVDLTEHYKICFRDYWVLLKDTERLELIDLQEADILLKRRLNCKEGRDSEKFPDEYDKTDGKMVDHADVEKTFMLDTDDRPDGKMVDHADVEKTFMLDTDDRADGKMVDHANVEKTFMLDTDDRPDEVQASFKRKKSNKKTYVGWGSRELIEFLSSISKDTTKPLDHFGVSGIVRDYIRQKNLLQDKKKKTVMCDDNLRSLFNRKKVKYNLIHSLLDIHLAANAVSEDESLDDSQDDCGLIIKKKPWSCFDTKNSERDSAIKKRCFAALNLNNLKLIYLKRTLVVKLLSHPDTFEQKVVGCLVRVKNDLKSYSYQMSKKRYQLGLVTGIKKSSEEYKIKDRCTDILLCVSNICDDVKMLMLSEEDFEEDECNDLLLLAKQGLFKRLTVAEFEEKEASVHADIVNHWIDMELLRLEKEFERAHEKGWRQEMHDISCEQKLLSTAAERERRLEEVPEIIPDTEDERKENEREAAAAASNLSQGNKGESEQVNATCEAASEADSKTICNGGTPGPGQHDQAHTAQDCGTAQPVDLDNRRDENYNCKDENGSMHNNSSNKVVINLDSDEDEDLHPVQHEPERAARQAVNVIDMPTLYASEAVNATTMPAYRASDLVIGAVPPAFKIMDGASEFKLMWHYMDPQKQEQGPFSMVQMRQWLLKGFFTEDFKVWRTGQSYEKAISLKDAMMGT